MLLRDVYFAGREHVFRKALLFAGKDELLGLLEIELVGGVDEAVVSLFDFDEDVVVGPQLRVQELSEVRYLQEVSVLVLFYLQLASTVVIDAVEVDFVLFDFLDLLKCFGLCDSVDHAELEMLNGRLVG